MVDSDNHDDVPERDRPLPSKYEPDRPDIYRPPLPEPGTPKLPGYLGNLGPGGTGVDEPDRPPIPARSPVVRTEFPKLLTEPSGTTAVMKRLAAIANRVENQMSALAHLDTIVRSALSSTSDTKALSAAIQTAATDASSAGVPESLIASSLLEAAPNDEDRARIKDAWTAFQSLAGRHVDHSREMGFGVT